MSYLSDSELKRRLAKGDLVVRPLTFGEALGPASIDLRLGNRVKQFRFPYGTRPSPGVFLQGVLDSRNLPPESEYMSEVEFGPEGFVFRPGCFYVAHIEEYIEIPRDLAAGITGRSSTARLGIMVHITAGFGDPGFKGTITLEIVNVCGIPVRLYAGQRICQLLLSPMVGKVEVSYGENPNSRYQGQSGPTASRMDRVPSKPEQ